MKYNLRVNVNKSVRYSYDFFLDIFITYISYHSTKKSPSNAAGLC